MNELISVIVPVFRVEKYLQRCVDSIRMQTYPNLEIILVDDGSDDGCPAICDAAAKQDERIRVIHKQNGGLSDARNAGIDVAKGRYLAFVDSDDCISPKYLEYLYRAMQETGSQIAQCRFADFTEDAPPVYHSEYPAPTVFSKEQMLKNLSTDGMNVCSVVAWTKLYDATVFRDVRYTKGKLHEDEFTTYKLIDRAEKIAYLPAALYGYFQNSAGITGTKMHSGRLDVVEAFLERYDYYRKNGYESLLPLTANHLADNLIRLATLRKEARDPRAYSQRLEQLYRQVRAEISPVHLNRHNRLFIKFARNAAVLARLQSAYLFAGRVSGKLHLGALRRKLSNTKTQRAYRREAKSLLKDYDQDTILLLGAIEYDNLGDHAIVYAQRKFLEKIAPVIEIRDELYLNTREYLRSRIQATTVITIPGGGNMGNLWFSDEQRRRWILEDFPNNPIVVFPQTISYSDTPEGQKKLQESVELYNAHKNLTLCAREEQSFQKMQELYPDCRVLFVPDIVLSLPLMDGADKREGIALCLREDAERAITQKDWEDIKNSLKERHTFQISTIAQENIPLSGREKALKEIWTRIGSAQLCITDRLHGMIFCYLTKTPCIVLDNNNHKIQRTYDAWLKSCEYITFATAQTVGDLLDKTCAVTTAAVTPAHYEQLEETIRNGQDYKAH